MKTALRRLLAACSLLLTPILAFGQSRGVVEGKAASGNTIFISTPAASRQVDVNTSTTVPGAVLVSSGPAVFISTDANSSIPPIQVRNESNVAVSSMSRSGDVYLTGSLYKNGTQGRTLTCATGQYVGASVSSGGVVMAGSCQTSMSSTSGASGIVPVFSNSNTFDGPGQGFITSASTGVAISTTVTFNAAVYGVMESTAIWNLPMSSGTQTAWAGCDISGSSATFTTHNIGAAVLVSLYGAWKMSSTNLLEVTILMDGKTSDSSGHQIGVDAQITQTATSSQTQEFASAYFVGVSSGTHTVCAGAYANTTNSWTFQAGGNYILARSVKY